MKRKVIYNFILAVVSMFLVVGCGSNSKENPIAPVAPAGPYSFFNATTPVIVKKRVVIIDNNCTSNTCIDNSETSSESGSANISVQLLKFGLAEPGQTVQMKPFDYRYGRILNMVVDTDESGYAIFEYVAPEGNDYNAIIGQDVIIQAIFLAPPEEDEEVDEDEDEDGAPEVVLTQDFLLQFR